MDRRKFFAAIGAAGATTVVPTSALAEKLEHMMIEELEPPQNREERELSEMPAAPTLADFFEHRFRSTSHVMQSATRAMENGHDEEVILSCLLHDLVLTLIRPDHGWWGAQLFRPYVSEQVSWAINYHQPLRFYPDPEVGFEYPEMYIRMFGADYVPEPYIDDAYKFARNHKWYMRARLITMNDEYSFDRDARPQLETFTDIIGRHFKQPKEGLGFDNSPTAHMWRTLINPNRPL